MINKYCVIYFCLRPLGLERVGFQSFVVQW